MKLQYIFPTLQGLLCIGAALVYFYLGDWKRGTYWGAALVITIVVTL